MDYIYDWTKDLEFRFNGHKELHTLKDDKFHGSLTVNFSDGVPMNCNLNKHMRPKYRDMSTLTEGGKNV